MNSVSANEWDLGESLASLDQAQECLGYDVTVPLAEGRPTTSDCLAARRDAS